MSNVHDLGSREDVQKEVMSWANLYKKKIGSYNGHPVRNHACGVHDLKCEKKCRANFLFISREIIIQK